MHRNVEFGLMERVNLTQVNCNLQQNEQKLRHFVLLNLKYVLHNFDLQALSDKSKSRLSRNHE